MTLINTEFKIEMNLECYPLLTVVEESIIDNDRSTTKR